MSYNPSYIHSLIARCTWTWAKTYVGVPHEYIVRNKCPLSDEEFESFVKAQREFGTHEVWGKYNFPYLYIDGYKYWTMGADIAETTVINRQKVFNEFDGLNNPTAAHYSDEFCTEVFDLFRQTFSPSSTIYEAACGDGRTITELGVAPEKYTGVDPSEKAIQAFRVNHPSHKWRVFKKSFEEASYFWQKSDAVILATFGAASYIMEPYLRIIANERKNHFLMFYREEYCPEPFKDMHHFNYPTSLLKSIFTDSEFIEMGDYRIIILKHEL